MLRGANEVERRRKKLDSVFTLVKVQTLTPEANAHFSRYLCVLLSGFVEQATKELVREFVAVRSAEQVQRHVTFQLRTLRNIDTEKLKQLIESFDPAWWTELKNDFAEELDALTSVATIRNNISHGGDAGVTLSTVERYFAEICRLMSKLAKQMDTTTEHA